MGLFPWVSLYKKFSTSSRNFPKISLLVQRSPIIQKKLSSFENAYRAYFYETEQKLSRGPFKLSLGLLSEEDKLSTSSDPSQISLEDADHAARCIEDNYNSLPQTSPNRGPSEKLFFVIKKSLNDSWNFPLVEYNDVNFSTPLHQVAIDSAKSLFTSNTGLEGIFYNPGRTPFSYQMINGEDIFGYRLELLPPYEVIVSDETPLYAWLSASELRNSGISSPDMSKILSCLVE